MSMVVGSIHADFYISVDRFPQVGETVIGSGFSVFPGGKGANQAVGCARLGAETFMVGAVGGDDIGRAMVENLKRNGVVVKHIFVDRSVHTGVAFILLNTETGDNMIVVAPGADNSLKPHHVEKALEEEAQRVRTLLVQLEIPLETVYAALRKGKELGITTILNPAPAKPLDESVYRYVDVIVPNRIELEQLTGATVKSLDDVFRASEILVKHGVKAVVTTMGSLGAALVAQDVKKLVKAFRVRVVDTVGAGDAFCAGLAVAIGENMELEEAVRFANAVAALKITRQGAQSVPTRAEVESLLEKESTST